MNHGWLGTGTAISSADNVLAAERYSSRILSLHYTKERVILIIQCLILQRLLVVFCTVKQVDRPNEMFRRRMDSDRVSNTLVFSQRNFLIVLSATALHTLDFKGNLNDYFPRTNDDTFSYLGQIDQLRTARTMVPQMEYPAGYRPQLFARR